MLAKCKFFNYTSPVKPCPLSPRRSECPLNAFLETLGDKWSLLIVRDILFKRRTSYKDFLESGERVATNILAARLRMLESAGIITGRDDASDARKRVYRLTPKGLDLAPVLIEMILWGAKHFKTAAPPEIIRRMERDRGGFLADIRRNGGL